MVRHRAGMALLAMLRHPDLEHCRALLARAYVAHVASLAELAEGA